MEAITQTLGIARRKVLLTLIRTFAPTSYTTHQDEVLQVPSRDADRTIKVHVYRPANATSPAPVLVNFHASGFVIPMHGSDDEFALRIKDNTPYTVFDVQYRLAPEHPFPAAINDAEDVVNWLLSRPEEFEAASISVSGFSAGGNLALALCGHVLPKNTFRNVLAFYPPVNIAHKPNLKEAPDPSGRPIPSWIATLFNDCYTPPPIDRKSPSISPYFIDGDRFPDSSLFITCGFDNLAPEAEELAKKIESVPGKHVVQRRMEKCGHAWDKSYKPSSVQEKAKDEAYDLAVEMLRRQSR